MAMLSRIDKLLADAVKTIKKITISIARNAVGLIGFFITDLSIKDKLPINLFGVTADEALLSFGSLLLAFITDVSCLICPRRRSSIPTRRSIEINALITDIIT